MLKKLVLLVAVLAAFLSIASPALALQGVPTTYYVDTSYTGTEMGTPTQPYNTLAEAVAKSQTQPYGGYIYIRQNNTWAYYGYVAPVYPPDTGTPLSSPVLFILVGIASVILVLLGWLMMRRSRAQTH